MSRHQKGRSARRRAWRAGISGETLAVWLLRLKGYRILSRRFRCPQGEIDIVARRGALITFVEVKVRAAGAADLAESITPRQRRRIERAALVFLQHHPALAEYSLRFDALLISSGRWPQHIADAWRPSL